MIKLRNTLFTAITRSRAWVKICGVGDDMTILKEEVEKCVNNDYKLEFTIPTLPELERLRLIHGDKTEDEKKKIEKAADSLKDIIELVEKGLVDPSTVPQLEALLNIVQSQKDKEDFE